MSKPSSFYKAVYTADINLNLFQGIGCQIVCDNDQTKNKENILQLSMFKLFQTVALILFVNFVSANSEPSVVKVGGYSFPPFLDFDESDHAMGMTMDLIQLFNESQSRFQFEFVSTTPKRRYQNFNDGKFDMMLFEDKKWGWGDYPVSASNVFLNGGEVYIARNIDGRDQSFFNDIKDKKIIAILGYHYGFSNFSSDEEYLKNNFTIYLTTSHKNSIRAVAEGSEIADVAVVTQSFLSQYLLEKPEYKDRLLISERYDQKYQHTALVRDDATISVKDINDLLKSLKSEGKLQQVWQKYGIH
jgi:ABC-type amino acid transport substrate-binding protein